jgi:hypothetical protein
MAEPITIKKKKKLTIKSKAAKAPASDAAPAPDAAPLEATADTGAEATPSVTPDEAGGSPLDYINQAAPAAAAKQPSYLIFAILALLATLIFIYIVIIQWTEFSFLQSAFPRPIQTGY